MSDLNQEVYYCPSGQHFIFDQECNQAEEGLKCPEHGYVVELLRESDRRFVCRRCGNTRFGRYLSRDEDGSPMCGQWGDEDVPCPGIVVG